MAIAQTMSKDYARSLDKIHHKILQDLVKLPENSFCADCAMRGTLSFGAFPSRDRLEWRANDECPAGRRAVG